MKKTLAVLGSTGSIGTNVLRVVERYPDRFSIQAIAANSSVDQLVEQAEKFDVPLVVAYDPESAEQLRNRLPNREVLSGVAGLNAAAAHPDVDLVMQGISGTRGIAPTFAAVEAGKTIGLANKESLVSGGSVVMRLAQQTGATILPVDSEHSAIFQCLQGQDRSALQRIILTASGGPFRSYTAEQLSNVTVDQALNHPSWSMGAKVTIDSSTLMNKGLEVIEAHWLFDMDPTAIDVIVHPQSICHSFVEFCDGSLLAQVGQPDMVVPIQYAMTYPERHPGFLKPFNFTASGTLEFFEPNKQLFRCLQLAYDALEAGGSLACYMNAANEVLVTQFLQGQISWMEIGTRLDALMQQHDSQQLNTLDDILAVDAMARAEASGAAALV